MKKYIELLRIDHWFKNIFLLVGIGSYFLLNPVNFLPEISVATKVITTFLLASFISSANYIINQVVDIKFDREHPDKKHRPLPSGKISIKSAYMLCLLVALTPLIVSRLLLGVHLQIVLLVFFVAGIAYNIRPVRLKDAPYIDVLSESFNNPIRFLLGWYIFTPDFPPVSLLFWTWFLGAMLMTAKRFDELKHYGKSLVSYRNTFKTYTLFKLKTMMIVYFLIATLLLSMFTVSVFHKPLVFVLPFTLFLVWVLWMVLTGRAKARSIESFTLSRKFLIILAATLIAYTVLIIWY